jgi:hypothetical protein
MSMITSATSLPLIPLEAFLEVLIGSSDFASMAAVIKGKTAGMFVRVVQFVQFIGKVDKSKLLEMFRRSVGIVCKPYTPFVDLIIPVVVVPATKNVHEMIPQVSDMTVCLVQVKCRAELLCKSEMEEVATERLRREGCVPELNSRHGYVSLLLEIGYRPDLTRSTIGPLDFKTENIEATQIPIAIRSLTARDVLDPNEPDLTAIDNSFSSLLRAEYNPAELKSAELRARKALADIYGNY